MKYSKALEETAKLIDQECEASDENIREISEQRWAEIEKMYRNQPGSSGNQSFVENYNTFQVPLLKPLIKRVVNTTHRQFIKAEPMLIAVSEDGDTQGAEAVERLLEAVFRKAGVDMQGLKTLETAALHGKGMFRFWPAAGGFQMNPVHSKQMTVYPPFGEKLTDCKTFGHKYYLRKSQVLEKMEMPEEQGGWMKCDLKVNDNPNDGAGRDTDYDLQPVNPEIVEETDQGVEIRELFTYREIDGESAWWKVQFAKSACKILHYTKETPWYFDQALHYEYGNFFTSSSLAGELRGLQNLYTDLHNLLVVGSYTAAFPPVFLTGGSMGDKKWQHRIGAVYQLPGAVTFQTVPITFNPGVIPQMIQQCEKVAQTVAGVTPAGQGKQFTSHTTKAEVDLLAETQSNADEGYLMTAGMVYATVGEYVLNYLRENPWYAKNNYGHVLSPGWDTAKVRLEPTGRTIGDMPQMIVQKIQAAAQVIEQFQLQDKYDIQKLGESVLSYVGLPFPLERFRVNTGSQIPPQGTPPGMEGNDGGGGIMGTDQGDAGLSAMFGLDS